MNATPRKVLHSHTGARPWKNGSTRAVSSSDGPWPYLDDGTGGGSSGPIDSPCVPACPDITYRLGGPVQTGGTVAWNIFWQPNGTGWGSFRSWMDSFMNDLSGTTYYGNLTQYYQTDSSGGNITHIRNNSTLAGSQVDTSPYPSGAIWDSDVQQRLSADITAAGGPGAHANYQYNVILGTNSSGAAKNICAYDSSGNTHCFNDCYGSSGEPVSGVYGWHYWMTVDGVKVRYTLVSYAPHVCSSSDQRTRPPGCPNDSSGACHVDSSINVLAHETSELTTDPITPTQCYATPIGGAWYFTDVSDRCQEVADACRNQWYNQFIAPNGQAADIVRNGDYYNVSGEFNAAFYNDASYRCNPWFA